MTRRVQMINQPGGRDRAEDMYQALTRAMDLNEALLLDLIDVTLDAVAEDALNVDINRMTPEQIKAATDLVSVFLGALCAVRNDDALAKALAELVKETFLKRPHVTYVKPEIRVTAEMEVSIHRLQLADASLTRHGAIEQWMRYQF